MNLTNNNTMFNIFDESGLSPNAIANHLNAYGYILYYNKDIHTLFDIYCGITNNLEETKSRHKIESFLCVINCGSMEKATTVETKMRDLGYDIGNPPHDGNGAAEDTRYVYLFVKSLNTDPPLNR